MLWIFLPFFFLIFWFIFSITVVFFFNKTSYIELKPYHSSLCSPSYLRGIHSPIFIWMILGDVFIFLLDPCTVLVACEERVNIAVLTWLSSEGPPCLLSPWLASENLNFSFPRPQDVLSLCLKYINNVVDAELLLAFWEPGIGVRARRRLPVWRTPRRNPGHWVSNESPWQTAFPLCGHNSCRRNQARPVTPLRGGLLEACARFPLHLPSYAFSFYWFFFVSSHCNTSRPWAP